MALWFGLLLVRLAAGAQATMSECRNPCLCVAVEDRRIYDFRDFYDADLFADFGNGEAMVFNACRTISTFGLSGSVCADGSIQACVVNATTGQPMRVWSNVTSSRGGLSPKDTVSADYDIPSNRPECPYLSFGVNHVCAGEVSAIITIGFCGYFVSYYGPQFCPKFDAPRWDDLPDCMYHDANNDWLFDLRPIGDHDYFAASSYRVLVNPCQHILNYPEAQVCSESFGCADDGRDSLARILSSMWTEFDSQGQVMARINYGKGDVCGPGTFPYTMVYYVTCGPETWPTAKSSDGCTFRFEQSSPHACPIDLRPGRNRTSIF